MDTTQTTQTTLNIPETQPISAPRVMAAPKSLDIAITGRCNLACKYCFYADEMVALRDLPTERWLAFFAELGGLAVQHVTLTGGEAFTRPDFWELVDGVIANKLRYGILSNGTLITEATLAEFAKGKRRLRLNSIQVSMDGSRAEIHDASRPNSFERALRGLRLLVEAQFPVTVRVTVNRRNLNDLEAIAKLLLEDVGLRSFSTNEAYSCGAATSNAESMLLTPREREQAMRTLAMLAERYEGRIGASAGPLAYAKEFQRIEEALARGETGFPGRGRLVGCGGMWSKLDILHDGTIVPCHNLSDLRLGVIGEDDFQQVWLTHPVMVALRQRREILLESLETCRGCLYQGFCTGGCPMGALDTYGDLNARNPMNCYRVLKGIDPHFVIPEG
ncbi:MAG: radical SAM protein [Anaerolineae bacterium]|nr:radical SAM protein [Anaerolineae bacterium]